MASLDILAYLTELEEELEGRLGRAERKLARREVKGLVQDMAFRLAAMKRRAGPADVDYEMALEALRPPGEVADALARRGEEFTRRKWVKRGRLALVLAALAVLGALAVGAMTSQTSEAVFSYANGTENRTTSSTMVTFDVADGYRRLDYQVTGIVTSDEGSLMVTLLDPGNQVAYQETFTRKSGLYSRGNIPDGAPGTWTLVVDFDGASGSVRVDVTGVRSR